jgi:hypothetical protein
MIKPHLIQLFSLVAILTSAEEPRGSNVDPYENPLLWAAIIRR